MTGSLLIVVVTKIKINIPIFLTTYKIFPAKEVVFLLRFVYLFVLNDVLFEMRAERNSCARNTTLDWIGLFVSW